MVSGTGVEDVTITPPTGFTTLGSLSTSRGSKGSISVAYQNNVAAGTVDPSAFTTFNANTLVAATVAFKRS
jgi:hypothetical protein